MKKIFVWVILTIWTALIIINILLPKKDFSELENRYLSKLPSFSIERLISGKYMMEMDEFINDAFAFRDSWVGAKSTLEYILGKRENNGVFIGDDVLIEKIIPKDAELFEYNIKGVQNFSSTHNVPVYFMLIPSAGEINKNKLPLFAGSFNQKAFINNVYEQLDDRVSAINIYDSLMESNDEYIYYKTDHHWTADGAYISYVEACKALGIKARDYSELGIQQVSDSFYGTLYSKSGFRFISPDIMKAPKAGEAAGFFVWNGYEYVEYPDIYFSEYLQKKDKYSYFMGTNEAIVNIKTKVNTDKKLLVFKDSYAHSFIPYLLGDYAEITLMDLRYINGDIDQIVNIKDYSQVLFMYSIDIFLNTNNTAKLR